MHYFLRWLIGQSTFFVLGLGLVLAEVFVVRNLFGLTFVGGVALVFLWLASSAGKSSTNYLTYFVGIQLALSVFSRGDYLFTPTAQTASGTMPSDVAHIAEALFALLGLGFFMWGVFTVLFDNWCSVSTDKFKKVETLGSRSSLSTESCYQNCTCT